MEDNLLDRLEHLRRLGLRKGTAGLAQPTKPAPDDHSAFAGNVIPGEVADTPFGPAWVRTERFPLAQYPALAALLEVSGEALAGLGRDAALARLHPAGAAFLDTETTGLSLGADTYTFLIGIGAYEGLASNTGDGEPAFVVRQFFMRNPAEERAQLHLVEEALARCNGLVTFNGRTFDMPLVNNRFTLARVPPPLRGAPHLDLLPPARRLWRARLGSCALSELEKNVLGVQRTAGDVPGWMIPGIYRDYYHTGVGTDLMARVFYHNLVDITSMVLLAGRMAPLFERAHLHVHITQLPPLDGASLARCFDALAWPDACEATYRAALAGANAAAERALIFRELGYLLKRLERRAEAAALWEEWIGAVSGDDVTPYVELAKHHEWHTGDLAAARGWAAWAIHIAEGWPPGFMREETLSELRHRLARLERKLNGAADSVDPAQADE
jgi:uncharacterized protein